MRDHVFIFTILLFSFVKKCIVTLGNLFISKCTVLRFPMQFIRTFCWLCIDARELIFALCSRLDRGRAVYFTTQPACSIHALLPPISGNFHSLLAKSCVPYKVPLKFALPCLSTEFSFSFSKYQWNSRLFLKWMVIATANPSDTAYLANTADKLNTPKAKRPHEIFCSTIHRQ